MTALSFSSLRPKTTASSGQVLWGEAPRRQPVAPMIALALLLMLVAAPAALSGNGQSANPNVIMADIAHSTYEITGLMKTSNEHLAGIDANIKPLTTLASEMGGIAEATKGMNEKTTKLNSTLGGVGASVATSGERLVKVDKKLAATSKSMGALRTNVSGSAASTKAIVGEFTTINSSITAMDSNLKGVIKLMAASTPLTREFAENRTRVAIAGGDSAKYGVPNVLPNNRVMSIVLPMIHAMQNGGMVPARKDSAKASNFVVGTLLNKKVPDGTNVGAIMQPYDGFYGLPNADWFVNHQVNGF